MQHEQTTDLNALIAAHEALMEPYEAAFALEDEYPLQGGLDAIAEAQEPFYPLLLKTRRALLDHRPRTLDEVRRKAEFMAKDRAFVEWDAEDLDIPDIIAALTPVGDAKGLRHAA